MSWLVCYWQVSNNIENVYNAFDTNGSLQSVCRVTYHGVPEIFCIVCSVCILYTGAAICLLWFDYGSVNSNLMCSGVCELSADVWYIYTYTYFKIRVANLTLYSFLTNHYYQHIN